MKDPCRERRPESIRRSATSLHWPISATSGTAATMASPIAQSNRRWLRGQTRRGSEATKNCRKSSDIKKGGATRLLTQRRRRNGKNSAGWPVRKRSENEADKTKIRGWRRGGSRECRIRTSLEATDCSSGYSSIATRRPPSVNLNRRPRHSIVLPTKLHIQNTKLITSRTGTSHRSRLATGSFRYLIPTIHAIAILVHSVSPSTHQPMAMPRVARRNKRLVAVP